MKIGIFYYISNLEIFFRQNDLKRFSTLCPNADFGNMSVHLSQIVFLVDINNLAMSSEAVKNPFTQVFFSLLILMTYDY